MHIYAIGDLHLSFSAPKPMDVFGGWDGHVSRLTQAWRACVKAEDAVLIPGDISWAMQLSGAQPDLDFIGSLPGNKILLRGNHDYWWASKTRVEAALPESVRLIQNDACTVGCYAVGGTRGWLLPNAAGFHEADRKIFDRELMRLSLSLAAMPEGKRRLVMLHYPPLTAQQRDTEVTALLEAANVERVVYAHLHGPAHKSAFEGVHNGVTYELVSADYLQFMPKRIV